MQDRRRPVVVITGASAGVGRATALAFAQRGWNVTLVARGLPALEETQDEIEQRGGHALAIAGDVSDAEAMDAAADRTVAMWGRIDVWVNNAMVTVFAPAQEITPAEFKRVTEVTYLGQVHGTLAALRHMRTQGKGTIVQVGSALAYRSIPLQSAYCAAKAAVRGFTDSLRSELIHDNSLVRLTMVHLPAINTPQFDWARNRLPRKLQPVGAIYTPEVAARAIVRAALDAPRELWVGSSTIKAILATMAVPGLLDRRLARSAWDGQMTDEPAVPRPDNLFEPVSTAADAEGRFMTASKPRAVAAPASLARATPAIATLAAVAALISIARSRRRTRP